MRLSQLAFAWLLIVAGGGHFSFADEPDYKLFESKIRPVLVERCYACHSAEAQAAGKLKGGLLLDSRDGLLTGGDTGPAVVAGKPEESLLLQALRHEGVEMPPDGKLTGAVIEAFADWIKRGAADPRVEVAGAKKGRVINLAEERKFWCYQLPQRTAPPAVADGAWATSPIDTFILARLEAAQVKPAADAEPAVLVRRVYFDLVGLPPPPEEIERFVADPSPEAYERLVDRLLASPQFGERWGRHWLDLARFAESLTLRGFVNSHAWRYRDYVIESFNADTPYDRFVIEQVAGDLLPAAELEQRRRQMTATSFLALGNTNLEEQDKKQLVMDAIDEQLDTIGKTFLAQTIGCARCHDHKFDPIPTKDYYALAGILGSAKQLEHANVSSWIEARLPMSAEREAAVAEHAERTKQLQAELKELQSLVAKTGDKLQPISPERLPGLVVDDTQAKQVGAWKSSTHFSNYIGAGYLHDDNADKGQKTLTFTADVPKAGRYEVRLAYTAGDSRATAVPVTIMSADGEKTVPVNERVAPPIDGRFVSLGTYLFEKNGQGYVLVSNDSPGHVIADAVQFLAVDGADDDKAKPGASDAPGGPAGANAEEVGQKIKALEQTIKQHNATAPPADKVVTVLEEKRGRDAPIHIRGSVHTLGSIAPRGVLQVALNEEPPAMPAEESGRLQLGQWLASPGNPLTARVFANRVWHWMFGAGLVRTTDNFGTTGERPSHPELLDNLALSLIEHDWSPKALVRQIALSRTYRLASVADAPLVEADPDNRLFGRARLRRLEAECLADSMLATSGELQVVMGGQTFPANQSSDYGFQHKPGRRSVYAPVFRNALPEIFEAFDFADPSVSTGARSVSTIAPQALLLLNHPFVIDRAKLAAQRVLSEKLADDEAVIDRAWRLALGRSASDSERRIAETQLQSTADKQTDLASLFQAIFGSIDFRYVK